MLRVYRHYGADQFVPEKVKGPQANDLPKNKPSRSLWASPVDSTCSWRRFCEEEDFDTETLEEFFDFSLSEEAKIYRIRSIDDFFDFASCFYFIRNESIRDESNHFDWNSVSQEYDGIEVSISDCPDLYDLLYGWDVDSLVVWNPKVVKPISL